MSYQFGGQPDRPRCFGDERYHNPNTRECRGCTVQSSCRDNIVRARNYQAVAPPPPAGYQQVAYQIPPPSVAGHAPLQVQSYQQPPPQQIQRQQPQPTGIFPAPPQYGYGWLTDPMYYAMAASPPPMIPQLGEESFVERLGKNMAIDALRSLTWQLHLATRQWIWPTASPDLEPQEMNPMTPVLPPK